MDNNEKEDRKVRPFWQELLKDLAVALVITTIVFAFISPTRISQHSMQPTINDGDILLVNKLLYSKPQRGDIVIFKTDSKDENGNDKALIKRVIGVEGDVITIAGGKIFRNGTQLDESEYIYAEEMGEVYNYKVPKGKIYALGDHREVSLDSRTFGAVDCKEIIGQAVFRVWPLSDFGNIK